MLTFASARTLYRRYQRAEAAENGAIGHRGKRFQHERSVADVNVRKPAAVTRQVIEARQVRYGRSVADVNVLKLAAVTRQVTGKRFRHGRSIADVNVLKPVAVMRWVAETNIDADALLWLSTR